MDGLNKPYKAELAILYSSKNFNEGKVYFQFGNYEYRFKFINETERTTYNLSIADEYLVAVSLSYDLDDHFHLVFNEKEEAYYIRNGFSSSTPQAVGGKKRLLKPINIGKSLAEIFGVERFYDYLMPLDDQEYHIYCEKQFYGGFESLQDPLPIAFFPTEELRLFVQKTCPQSYITDHEEYEPKKISEFLSEKHIDKYFDIKSFFSKKLHPKDFIDILNSINQDMAKQRFLFVEFHPSSFYAIIDSEDLAQPILAEYLKYGIIYNKIDISEEIYEILK